jgi:rhodanese-related sulfurtransferase
VFNQRIWHSTTSPARRSFPGMKITAAILAVAATTAAPLVAQAPERKSPIQVGPSPVSKAAAKDVTAEEAAKLIAGTPGLIVLDVRTEEEFDHEHIKGAVNINALNEGFDIRVAALDQTKPVLVHCQSGRRSLGALKQMTGKVRFPQVYHLKDGFISWKNANQPFESKPLPGAGRREPAKKQEAPKPDGAK